MWAQLRRGVRIAVLRPRDHRPRGPAMRGGSGGLQHREQQCSVLPAEIARATGPGWRQCFSRSLRLPRRGWAARAGHYGSLIWCAAWFVLLSVFPDKRPRYLLVVYPLGALASGVWLARMARARARCMAAWSSGPRWSRPPRASPGRGRRPHPSPAAPQWAAARGVVGRDPSARLQVGALPQRSAPGVPRLRPLAHTHPRTNRRTDRPAAHRSVDHLSPARWPCPRQA